MQIKLAKFDRKGKFSVSASLKIFDVHKSWNFTGNLRKIKSCLIKTNLKIYYANDPFGSQFGYKMCF